MQACSTHKAKQMLSIKASLDFLNQANLLSNKTMQQKRETWPKIIQLWWHETYVLANELHELIAPETWSLATKTTSSQNVPPNNKIIAENQTYNLPSDQQLTAAAAVAAAAAAAKSLSRVRLCATP